MEINKSFAKEFNNIYQSSGATGHSYIINGLTSEIIGGNPDTWKLKQGSAIAIDRTTRKEKEIVISFDTNYSIASVISASSATNFDIWSYLDKDGVISYELNQPESWQLSEKICLNKIRVIADEISEIQTLNLVNDPTTIDLLDSGRSKNLNLEITPNAGLTVATSGGEILIAGGSNDLINPHLINIPASDPITFDEYSPTGILSAAGQTTLNFGIYWDEGSEEFVNFTGEDFTVKFLLVNPENHWISIVGRNQYDTFQAAKRYLSSFEKVPNIPNYCLAAIIIARQDAVGAIWKYQFFILPYNNYPNNQEFKIT